MMNSHEQVALLSSSDLLERTRELVERSRKLEADLLVHLGEIDERKLYLDRAFPSMFAFCVGEYGFSEESAYNRITVARLGRRLPSTIEALRSGNVHLAGLRLLAPHLTVENHGEVLAQAAGRTKRKIEELVARLAPQPLVPATIRKVPEHRASADVPPVALAPLPAPESPVKREDHQPTVKPLAEDTFKVQFTVNGALRDKLRRAQDLLRHRVPDGDLTSIFDRALDALIEQVEKERFATSRIPRPPSLPVAGKSSSRHIPDAVKRAVYKRDGARCTFVAEGGRRCTETGGLEFDHIDGFALTRHHEVDRIRLLCSAHNQRAAEQTYGWGFMEQARSRARNSTRPGTSSQARLL